MSARRRLCAFALVAAALLPAPQLAHADETSPANVAAARKHFDKARADYAQGAYREAIGELEAAHALDPNAKDLVFNLGVVHEKLADIDDALKWFRLYTSMNLTPTERDRADAYVKRLEGAKKELDAKQAAAAAASAATPPPPPPPHDTGPPVHGRIDALTIAGASVTGVALVVGIVMAAKAEQDKPPANFVTTSTQTYDDLVNRVSTSHQEAVVADISFVAAAVLAGATTYLYLGRTRDPAPASSGSTSVSAAPLTGGAAFFVQGSF
jgi:tetratricopeptide (TPR) repeat protein